MIMIQNHYWVTYITIKNNVMALFCCFFISHIYQLYSYWLLITNFKSFTWKSYSKKCLWTVFTSYNTVVNKKTSAKNTARLISIILIFHWHLQKHFSLNCRECKVPSSSEVAWVTDECHQSSHSHHRKPNICVKITRY